MGNSLAHRGRLAPAIILAVVIVAVAIAALLAASSAQALPTFTDPVNGVGPCSNCHSYTYGDAFHSKTTHAAQACSKCHTVNTATAPLPSACASCHGTATQIISSQAAHGTAGCGSTATGCHGTTPPPAGPVATKMTAKVSPTTVKVRKSVTISGSVTPAAQLGGAKVGILVNRKAGAKWVKAKAATVTAKATGAYSWKYKVAKKGSYQVKVSVKATSTYTAKSVTKTFKAK